jgi:hypothetical protein
MKKIYSNLSISLCLVSESNFLKKWHNKKLHTVVVVCIIQDFNNFGFEESTAT